MAAQPPRIGHKKSRKGCAQCKRRHVKCNEAKPCSNCVRHGAACSLAGGPHVPREEDRSTKSPAESSASGQCSTTDPDTLTGSEYQGVSALNRLTQTTDRQRTITPEQTWMSDLQLMHHFDKYAHEIIDEPDLVEIWQREIPVLAFSSHSLMHIVLGFSALHLATKQPSQAKALERSAVSHLDQALTYYKQDDSAVSAENAAQKFCFTIFVCIFAYATTSSPPPIDALCEVFTLVKSIDTIASETFQWIIAGPFAPMMNRSLHEVMRTAPRSVSVIIPSGMELGLNHLDFMLKVEHVAADDLKALTKVLDELKQLYSNILQAGDAAGLSLVICWPKQTDTTYEQMLRQRTPQALVILAHYCVVLHLLNHKWFLKGWGMKVLQNILDNLDDRWTSWIQWPVTTIFTKVSSTPPQDDATKMVF